MSEKMSLSNLENDIPQWKKDLIARLRNQNKLYSVSTTDSGEPQQLYSSPPHHPSAAVGRVGQQPSLTCNSSELVASSVNTTSSVPEKCNVLSPTRSPVKTKMVQERNWEEKHENFDMVSDTYSNGDYHKESDSDSSEDLHYGPGIVSKLKNKYLSLASRENVNRRRPSILQMRKATSLENMLDDEVSNGPSSRGNRLFQPRLNGSNDTTKNVPNRYRTATRGLELKRARSVEAISRSNLDINVNSTEVRSERTSLHEDMLINSNEGNDKPYRKMLDKKIVETTNEHNKFSNNTGHRINRPKRITPIMNEKEKPPADVVKQAKMIFERRPENRTKAPHSTGDVASKVDTYNNIIGKAKASKKPIIKHKPPVNEKARIITPPLKITKQVSICKEEKVNNTTSNSTKNVEVNKVSKTDSNDATLLSPIPDISRIDFNNKFEKDKILLDTPDLILTSSPIAAVTSPTYKKTATERFIIEEIKNNSPKEESKESSILSPINSKPCELNIDDVPDSPGYKKISPTSLNNISKTSGTAVFNFANTQVKQSHLPTNINVSNTKTPPSEPLKIEINGLNNGESKKVTSPKHQAEILSPRQTSPKFSPNKNEVTPQKTSPKISPPKCESTPKPNLTVTEIEKNLINTVKTLQQPSASVNHSAEVNKIVVPKVKRPQEPAPTSSVFNFTNRKDVPDYISNDRSRSPGRPELPKPGEGGIILIPGATILDSYTDEEEEWRSLEGPPSPCDVTFINDNILIDGKSSLSQKSKKVKMRISFVDAGPEIFEYPSETSLILDDLPVSPTPKLSHTVPNLSGSTLANYTPKSTEDFQLGITRPSIPVHSPTNENDSADPPAEIEEPVLFSAGNNSDILF